MALHQYTASLGAAELAICPLKANRSLNIKSILFTNSSGTPQNVTLRDGIGGATFDTIPVPPGGVSVEWNSKAFGIGKLLTAGNALSGQSDQAAGVTTDVEYGRV